MTGVSNFFVYALCLSRDSCVLLKSCYRKFRKIHKKRVLFFIKL